MFFLFTLLTFCTDSKIVTNLEDMFSLFNPAVDENGRSYRYLFHNDYIIKTYSSDMTFIQLGYAKGKSSAALESKNPFPFNDFRADTKFTILPYKKPGDGFGIFLSPNKFISGTNMGRADDNDSISIKIITSGKEPFIELKVGDQLQKEKLNGDVLKKQCVLRIENYNNTFRVFLKIGEKDYHHIFNVYGSNLKKDMYFCISASNTNDYNYLRIYDVKVSSLLSVDSSRVIIRRGGVWVWIVFVVAVVALMCYLFKRQVRDPMRKL